MFNLNIVVFQLLVEDCTVIGSVSDRLIRLGTVGVDGRCLATGNTDVHLLLYNFHSRISRKSSDRHLNKLHRVFALTEYQSVMAESDPTCRVSRSSHLFLALICVLIFLLKIRSGMHTE